MKKLLLGVLLGAAAVGGSLVWRVSRAGWVERRLSVREFVSGMSSVQPDLKLVVAKVELVKTMEGESAKSVLGLDLGTTRAVLSVPARVHYAVDLTAPEPVAFRYDRPSRVLTAEFAEPEVQAVEVFFQDKRLVVEPGWGRLKERSGKALSEALERGVYDSVRRDGAGAEVMASVREKARPVLARFLEGYLQRAGMLRVDGGVEAVAVRFKGEGVLGVGQD